MIDDLAEGIDFLRSKERTMVLLAQEMGYRLHVVDRAADIPNVPREFEECLHVSGDIWSIGLVGDLARGVPHEATIFHELGHAFSAECYNKDMHLGVHWVVPGLCGDESDACAVASMLMKKMGMSPEYIDAANEHVNHYGSIEGDREKANFLEAEWEKVWDEWRSKDQHPRRVKPSIVRENNHFRNARDKYAKLFEGGGK